MQPYVMAYIWIGIAAFLTAVEIATVQLVSVWFVLGALCAALTTIFTDSIVIQIVVFVSVSLVTLIATRPLVKKAKQKIRPLRTNSDRLIGETGVMFADLNDMHSVGQAKVMGKVWSVKTDNPPQQAGDTVRVLAIEGVKLIVEKLN